MKSARYHKCSGCNGPASLGLSTGIRSNSDDDAPLQPHCSVPAEEGATRLATHLGLTAIGVELNTQEDAAEELRNLWRELIPSCHEQEQCRHPIVCCFCAKYLPSLVLAFKADHRPAGPYHVMLLAVAQGVYFAKFMRTPAGANFYAFYVSRVLIPQCWECAGYDDVLRLTVGLVILSTYAHDYKSQMQPLSAPTILQLKGWIRARTTRAIKVMQLFRAASVPRDNYNYSAYESVVTLGISVLNILDGKLKHEAKRLTLTRRETFDRYAALHNDPNEIATRRECVRCQTVAYCCQTHQRQDWEEHKERCFETVY
ncbi:hypothetical protein B0H16DRAFT_1530217 [Mycena metata]|uniref:MYND-type domain-containing protein n=1 Tax=Mycena metata TaxID=1033252 RepID=A0AAD7JC06_9AGAR|nr:hypothetical protein B0H16DRAFT_1530217 [Mycena metata]